MWTRAVEKAEAKKARLKVLPRDVGASLEEGVEDGESQGGSEGDRHGGVWDVGWRRRRRRKKKTEEKQG